MSESLVNRAKTRSEHLDLNNGDYTSLNEFVEMCDRHNDAIKADAVGRERPECLLGMSEFWKRKMRTYFHTFDLDKDGVISKADWLGMPTRFAEIEKADKQKADHLIAQFENVWEQFMNKSGSSEKKFLTVEVLSDSVAKQLYDPELMKHFTGLVKALFDLLDLNRDGYLQDDEYEKYLAQLGVQNASFAREALHTMDVNGDGKLSLGEFLNAFWDFFFSDDEKSPNAFFFGPLVD